MENLKKINNQSFTFFNLNPSETGMKHLKKSLMVQTNQEASEKPPKLILLSQSSFSLWLWSLY